MGPLEISRHYWRKRGRKSLFSHEVEVGTLNQYNISDTIARLDCVENLLTE